MELEPTHFSQLKGSRKRLILTSPFIVELDPRELKV
jgi:hypothetical protein